MADHTQNSEYKRAALCVPLADAQRQLQEQITKGNRLIGTRIASKSGLDRVRKDFLTWSDYNKDLLKSIIDTPELFSYYNSITEADIQVYASAIAYAGADELRAEVREHIRRLRSILDRLPLMPQANAPRHAPEPPPISNRVFIVHGHDEAAKYAAADCIKRLDFEPIILQEQPNQGRTVIEKFEEHAEDITFAVVLLTPDDVGAAKTASDHLQGRARQNVILELGYFIGALGRKNVCALYKGAVELPSDILGILWIEMDAGGAWRFQLAREMRAAGLSVDLNKL